MTDRDHLTDAMSRESFKKRLADIRSNANTKGSNFALLWVDIDNMKHFNTHNGHLAGDELLKQFVSLVEPLLGNRHSLFRVGGDEFIVILPNFSRDAALQVSQQICDLSREKLGSSQPNHCGDPQCMGPAKISVSIGIGLFVQNMNLESFLHDVEEKRHEAKRAGKDRVTI
jgi:diguanylate cyclase (GGDEF)-like protein